MTNVNPETTRDLARMAFEVKDYKKAAASWEELVQANTRDAEALYYRGLSGLLDATYKHVEGNFIFFDCVGFLTHCIPICLGKQSGDNDANKSIAWAKSYLKRALELEPQRKNDLLRFILPIFKEKVADEDLDAYGVQDLNKLSKQLTKIPMDDDIKRTVDSVVQEFRNKALSIAKQERTELRVSENQQRLRVQWKATLKAALIIGAIIGFGALVYNMGFVGAIIFIVVFGGIWLLAASGGATWDRQTIGTLANLFTAYKSSQIESRMHDIEKKLDDADRRDRPFKLGP